MRIKKRQKPKFKARELTTGKATDHHQLTARICHWNVFKYQLFQANIIQG